jgi:hypothetical protein
VGFESPGRRASALAPLALAALLAGCWSKSNNALPDAVPPCNDLKWGSSFVQEIDAENATEPAPTGGSMTSGSYHLTSTTYYPNLASGCAVAPVATVLQVTSSSPTTGTIQTASVTSAGFAATESTTYESSGTALRTRIDCLAPDPGGVVGGVARISYSATATELQLYTSSGCGNRIDVYDLD